jgi:hypothetical protein
LQNALKKRFQIIWQSVRRYNSHCTPLSLFASNYALIWWTRKLFSLRGGQMECTPRWAKCSPALSSVQLSLFLATEGRLRPRLHGSQPSLALLFALLAVRFSAHVADSSCEGVIDIYLYSFYLLRSAQHMLSAFYTHSVSSIPG